MWAQEDQWRLQALLVDGLEVRYLQIDYFPTGGSSISRESSCHGLMGRIGALTLGGWMREARLRWPADGGCDADGIVVFLGAL